MANRTPYEPILFKLAKRGFPCFSRVIHYFKNYNLETDIGRLKVKNTCEYFLVAESDCWELYEDATSGVIFQCIKRKMKEEALLTEDKVASRLATAGYSSVEDMEKDKIATLILIHHLVV